MPDTKKVELPSEPIASRKVLWGVLMERSLPNEAVSSLLDVAGVCGKHGFKRIVLGYMRVDLARNLMIQAFLENSDDDDDVLVMLDADHTHPAHTVAQLASYPKAVGVAGALAYRRGGKHDPCWYVLDDNNDLRAAMEWDNEGLYQCDAVGSAAIAIKRWVFTRLNEAGYSWPYFRYEYPTEGALPSEDIVFARACINAGIKHHCDTGLMTPHILTDYADGRQWQEFIKTNGHTQED